MSAIAEFDLRTLDGIEAAEADLARFQNHVATCVTRDLLPWSMIIGRRLVQLAEARARLVHTTRY